MARISVGIMLTAILFIHLRSANMITESNGQHRTREQLKRPSSLEIRAFLYGVKDSIHHPRMVSDMMRYRRHGAIWYARGRSAWTREDNILRFRLIY